MIISGELDEVEGKTPAEIKRGHTKVFDKYFGEPDAPPRKGMFADPAAMFAKPQ